MPNNKLSIYLIKSEFTDPDDIIEYYDDSTDIPDVGTVYIGTSHISTPTWINSFFRNRLNNANIFTANARVVLLVRVPLEQGQIERIFAITLGYGRNLLIDGVVEERFGLKVILNTIEPDSLRKINKVNIGGNQKQSMEQLPLKSEITEFGFDVYRDLISSITGVSNDEDYVTGVMAGSDILTLSAPVTIANIREFLVSTYQKYRLLTYRTNFGWIDQIQFVKDPQTINLLNEAIVTEINNNSPTIWMAVPEVINWEEISGFKYHGQTLFDDIYINEVKASFRAPLESIDQFKSKNISAIDALDESVRFRWSAYKCLLGEIALGNSSYCLNSGKWYKVDNDYVNLINQDYDATEVSEIQLGEYSALFNSEGSYNQHYQLIDPEHYVCMDQKNIVHGGGHSRIELCDLLTNDMQLVHIKKNTGSSALSHLFSQAAVSTELLLSDPTFVAKANNKIRETCGSDDFMIRNVRDLRIVFGIITKGTRDLPAIPFFSKVAFRYTKYRLNAFGLNVSLKAIRDVR